MPGFQFDKAQSFDDNWQAFMASLEAIDAGMAAILRTNANALADIVKEGERDSKSRAEFNEAVASALDALITPDSQQQGT